MNALILEQCCGQMPQIQSGNFGSVITRYRYLCKKCGRATDGLAVTEERAAFDWNLAVSQHQIKEAKL